MYWILFLLFTCSSSLYIPISRSNLKKNQIHKISILDKDLAVWWGKDKWSVVDNVCKHRQGDLSLGVITPEGKLKCGYHGWEYNSKGICEFIPSCQKKTTVKLDDYQIEEKYKMLWLKKDESSIFSKELEMKNIKSTWFVDDVDLPHELLIENALDSLHFDHVHSGTPPPVNRYKPQKRYVNPASSLNWYNETGFSCNVNTIEYKFIAPFTVIIDFGGQFSIYAQSIPISTFQTKFISTSLIPYSNSLAKIMMNVIFTLMKPFTNSLGTKIFDQDLTQIGGQYKNILKHGPSHLKVSKADDPITYFHKWQKEFNSKNI